jgi:hypothetical protein
MTNKTISINPSLFSIGSVKTKKNRVKTATPKPIKPLINPNILKNKLLKRIKEHKQRETQGMDAKNTNTNIKPEPEIHVKTDNFSDEFSDSINYLQTLSKQKKINDERTNYEKQKQKRREELERKTLKNHQSSGNLSSGNLSSGNLSSGNLSSGNLSSGSLSQQHINIDLPEELAINMNMTHNQANMNPMVLNKYTIDNIPYGVLKGGIKPTYRDWSKTQRNNMITNPNASLSIQGGGVTKQKIERETRLQSLREKLKNKQAEENNKKLAENNETIQSIQPIQSIQSIQPIQPIQSIQSIQSIQPIQPNITSELQVKENLPIPQIEILNVTPLENSNEQIIATKKTTKRTIKRKYTLGKSKIKKAVGVLIKDRGTRKKVISAQKDLKKRPINDIKNYLREHNLIKVGSNAPNDVIRKLYESAMLAGEITNSNSETLLHNFSKDDKQL